MKKNYSVKENCVNSILTVTDSVLESISPPGCIESSVMQTSVVNKTVIT